MEDKAIKNGILGSLLAWSLIVFMVMELTGCIIPSVLGVKSYETKESRTEFITGIDLGIAMNGIDEVKDQKGISPTSAKLFKAGQ